MLLGWLLCCGKKKIIIFTEKTNAWKYLLLWETTALWYYILKSCQKNTVWITSNVLKCLVLCLQIAPWHEMCFAAVTKVHQSLGWGKIQTGGVKKKVLGANSWSAQSEMKPNIVCSALSDGSIGQKVHTDQICCLYKQVECHWSQLFAPTVNLPSRF